VSEKRTLLVRILLLSKVQFLHSCQRAFSYVIFMNQSS